MLNFKYKNINKEKTLIILFVIILAVILRLIPHLPNFTPIGALALFSGAHITSKKAYGIPILAMILSDIFLGFHSTIFFVYSSFIAIVFLGRFISSKKNILSLTLFSLYSSLLFFIVTNFGVWLMSSMYQKSINGLINAYFMGIPFYRNTLISDMLYTFSFFYGFNFLSFYLPRLVRAYTKP